MLAGVSPADIEKALQDRDYASLRAAFADLETADVAVAIDQLEPEDRAVVFRLLPRDQAGETFEYLSPESQEGLIKALARWQVASILNDMSPDDRTALLEELPAPVTRQVLALLTPDERAVARNLLGYPEDSIGRLMTPDVIAVRSDWTVQQSLDHVRENGEDSETLNVIYVVDERNHLLDDLRVRQLLLADPQQRISELTDGHFISLEAQDDQEDAVQVFKEYDRVAFPVTDSQGVLLGIVTVDDVLEVAVEEATEDIQKIGGSEALEDPYMAVGFLKMLRKRALWLVALFVAQSLTLTVMGFYTDQIAQAVALVLFVPLIISSGGNSGTQAATLVVRAMALEEVSLDDWWRVARREAMFGTIVGLMLASIGFARIGLGQGIGGAYGEKWAELGIAVGLSLICVVLWGVVVGSMLPFLLRRVGADPATSSAPVVATVVDISGLMIYFSAATFVLHTL